MPTPLDRRSVVPTGAPAAYSAGMTSPARARSRELLVGGRSRLSLEARDARDRVLASDPGLARLRQGVSAVVAVATTVAVEAVFVRLVGVASQTADIAFTSKPLRRIGTIHGIVAFTFNTVVLALTINLLAGLFGGD